MSTRAPTFTEPVALTLRAPVEFVLFLQDRGKSLDYLPELLDAGAAVWAIRPAAIIAAWYAADAYARQRFPMEELHALHVTASPAACEFISLLYVFVGASLPPERLGVALILALTFFNAGGYLDWLPA